ncbi:uncharacterized protein LOC113274265 [Papaver somniferum]|uniref:uncharacterized protein LOC113274265 n=1 Tax=Papaver somniferum TaxID=3469 RepID=UPI000E6F572D|nr:uncharacterized protein LOC113274265 [Papaver somniferum]
MVEYNYKRQSLDSISLGVVDKNICPKCFAIDHDDRKCMYTFHLLYLDTLNDEEYQDYLNNEADVYEGNERESMDKDEMALIMESIGNEHESRQRKRMRNSELNNEPLMNPHNIHVQPPNTTNPANTTNRGNCNNSMMEATEPRANTAETTVHSQSHTMQVAYVPGREIGDNITLTHEIIHCMHKKKTKKGYMALKLDMSKAFDRVEWSFLRRIMEIFGFADHFCSLIQECVSTS